MAAAGGRWDWFDLPASSDWTGSAYLDWLVRLDIPADSFGQTGHSAQSVGFEYSDRFSAPDRSDRQRLGRSGIASPGFEGSDRFEAFAQIAGRSRLCRSGLPRRVMCLPDQGCPAGFG